MESVRGQLQTMLHTSRDTAYRKSVPAVEVWRKAEV